MLLKSAALLVSLAMLLSLACAAQQSSPPDAPQADAQSSAPSRPLRFLNSFLGTPATAAGAHRLTARDKFMLANHFLGPFSFITAAATAGVSQAADTHQAWGQGAEGFGKRYGAAFGDAAVYNYLGVAVFPSLFHQDPRYFSKGSGGFGSRAAYAASRALITRGDSGRRQFNFSNVLAAFAAGGVGTAYYPSNEREPGDAAVRGAIQLGSAAAWNVLMEFAPDVERKLFHHRSSK